MVVVSRFRVAEAAEDGSFRDALTEAHAALAACAGYLHGTVGRSVDDPSWWVLVTTWRDVGSYRRALSSYDVKLRAVAVLSRAVEEPSAYEVVEPGTALNEAAPRSLG